MVGFAHPGFLIKTPRGKVIGLRGMAAMAAGGPVTDEGNQAAPNPNTGHLCRVSACPGAGSRRHAGRLRGWRFRGYPAGRPFAGGAVRPGLERLRPQLFVLRYQGHRLGRRAGAVSPPALGDEHQPGAVRRPLGDAARARGRSRPADRALRPDRLHGLVRPLPRQLRRHHRRRNLYRGRRQAEPPGRPPVRAGRRRDRLPAGGEPDGHRSRAGHRLRAGTACGRPRDDRRPAQQRRRQRRERQGHGRPLRRYAATVPALSLPGGAGAR